MRRKILKHYTDIFCDMFTGWRLSEKDIEIMQTLGTGKLHLDFLTEKLYFDENEIETELYILKEIST